MKTSVKIVWHEGVNILFKQCFLFKVFFHTIALAFLYGNFVHDRFESYVKIRLKAVLHCPPLQ